MQPRPRSDQGEFQAALGALNSITSVIGPTVRPQLFAAVTAPAAVYCLGVAFFVAALPILVCLVIFGVVVRRNGRGGAAAGHSCNGAERIGPVAVSRNRPGTDNCGRLRRWSGPLFRRNKFTPAQ